jgi:type I restriction enzyme S subunit
MRGDVNSSGPTGWKQITLGDIVSFRREPIDPQANPGMRYVGLEHIESGRMELLRWGTGAEVRSLKNRFFTGDILYGKLRPYLDKAVLADFDGLCSTDIIVISCSKRVLPDFLVQILHSREFIAFADSTTTGVNHPRTSWNALKEFGIRLPALPEQRAIASVLSTIRRSQSATREVVDAARQMKKTVMASSFSNGSWPRVTLGSVAHLIMGQSPPSEFYNSTGEGLPFLQGKAEFSEKYPHSTKYCTQKLKVAPRGSVLMSVRAPVGDTNVADRDYVIGRGVASFQLKSGNNGFLFYVLSYLKPQIESLGTGTTFDSVNKGILEQIEIPLPPVEEQERLSTMLSNIDNKIAVEESLLNELQGFYQTLLHELLSGGIKLPVSEVDANA